MNKFKLSRAAVSDFSEPAAETTKPALTPLGFVQVEGEGRRNRWKANFKLRCNAYAVSDETVLMVSAAGDESSTKALAASLQSPDMPLAFGFAFDEAPSCYRKKRSQHGYKAYRTKLPNGQWNVLLVTKDPHFMPVYDDVAVWEWLRGPAYTTPVVQAWLPFLQEKIAAHHLADMTAVGCHPALLQLSDEQLDAIVSQGLIDGAIKVPGDSKKLPWDNEATDLDSYMLKNGALLGRRAERSLDPLHVPGRDPLPHLDLLREPFEAQAHVIAATAKALKRQKTAMMVAAIGSGKSLMGSASIHLHANGRPYRAMVMCPAHLCLKWQRELEETIPGAQVRLLDEWADVLTLDRSAQPTGPEWYIISTARAKLGSKWSPAFVQRCRMPNDGIRCPRCGGRLVDDDGLDVNPADGKKKRVCEFIRNQDGERKRGCGEQLWSYNRQQWRYEPALIIKRRLKGFFKYLICDEFHEEKGEATARANALGSLVASVRHVVVLSGSLIGGYADHLRPLLFRLAPASLVREGLVWENATAFNERYGRIETVVREKSGGGGDDNRQSRGSSKTTTKNVKPGIMPALFGRHLIDKAVFLQLSEVAHLQAPDEEVITVPMDTELRAAYDRVEKELTATIKKMLVKGDKRLLGSMLNCLLCYPDYPFLWNQIGYMDHGHWHGVVQPDSLDQSVVRAKEKALIDLCLREKAAKRQVWVYIQYTDKHPVQDRLAGLLEKAGLKVKVLKASVDPKKREAWIQKHAPGTDVIVSHPELVQTGLDFFDKHNWTYNFPTLVFFETGYQTFVMRQAAGRSWRIGQTQPCRIIYMAYEKSMQERAIALMGRKLAASLAIEGKFSTEGLVAMGGDEWSMETALARSLVSRMDEGDVRRIWAKVGGQPQLPPPAVEPQAPEPEPEPEPPTPSPLSGADLTAQMRERKVKVADLAAALGVSSRAVSKARKHGVPDGEPWQRALDGFPVPMPKPTRKRRSVLTAMAAAACWLSILIFGDVSGMR